MWLSAEFFEDLRQFGNGDCAIALLNGFLYAPEGVVFDELSRHGFECRLNGADLGQDVDAVAVILDHAIDALNLTADTGQSIEQGSLMGLNDASIRGMTFMRGFRY